MNEKNKKLPVEVFMRPVRVLVYSVINLETQEVSFRDYYYEPCGKIKNDLNKKEGRKIFKVICNFEEAQDITGYEETFIEEEDLDDLLENF